MLQLRFLSTILLVVGSLILASCQLKTDDVAIEDDKTQLLVIGALHQGHVKSQRYSLAVLEKVIRDFAPDQVFVEIPPDRLPVAKRGFAETGKVTEARTAVFPEYRDMLFPLSRKLNFEMIPVAGWTQEMADNRRAALKRIENDPARAKQWAEYKRAVAQFNKEVSGRRDDPLFIHSPAYNRLVENMQRPYQEHFDADLGAGGWTQINAAHYGLIDQALDRISGQRKKVIIIFGAWHKYMFLNELEKREDIMLVRPAALFK